MEAGRPRAHALAAGASQQELIRALNEDDALQGLFIDAMARRLSRSPRRPPASARRRDAQAARLLEQPARKVCAERLAQARRPRGRAGGRQAAASRRHRALRRPGRTSLPQDCRAIVTQLAQGLRIATRGYHPPFRYRSRRGARRRPSKNIAWPRSGLRSLRATAPGSRLCSASTGRPSARLDAAKPTLPVPAATPRALRHRRLDGQRASARAARCLRPARGLRAAELHPVDAAQERHHTCSARAARARSGSRCWPRSSATSSPAADRSELPGDWPLARAIPFSPQRL